MEPLQIPGTNDTPEVIFNIETGTFSISGVSLPENPGFYKPILNWLTSYMDHPLEHTVFDIRFKYFNTSSAKQIVQMLFILECINNSKKVTLNWYYRRVDTSMYSAGAGYAKLLKLNFNLIEY
ncbi:MAG: DUF1987 domain-containing protein [Bacteroidia bacterium]|nr:DUF1987 domain-containing protein [Bacteroidia bacterium]